MKKTILITGSTDGIGKLAALKLAQAGHQIILHGRNAIKLSKGMEEIKNETQNEAVSGVVADFSDLAAVQEMAAQIKSTHSKIDVLINNAGVFKSAATYNKDHLDLRYVVNYFAPYLLTKELLPLLKNATQPRVINLSSAAQDSIAYPVFEGKVPASERATYGQSKLALTMWSFHLAKVAPELMVIAVNPGSLLNTNMVKEAFGQFWSSADKGADILYELAVSAEYQGQSGKYFDNDLGDFGAAHADADDAAKIEKLIAETEKILST